MKPDCDAEGCKLKALWAYRYQRNRQLVTRFYCYYHAVVETNKREEEGWDVIIKARTGR